jgi:uncharacterized protein (TIGR02611 family)
MRPAFDESPHDDSMLETVAERFGFRDRIRAHPVLGWVYRILVGLVGAAILAIGIVLIPAPGPGWLIVFLGLGVLGTEFAWARRLLQFCRRYVHRWTEWIKKQSLPVRVLVGLAGLILLAGLGLFGAYSMGWRGFPFA